LALVLQKILGRSVMTKIDSVDSPRQNPCAQCGEPIAAPDWMEAGPRRVAYLWNCRACGYRFEAVAFFEDANSESSAIAA
jgi:ribosomal protein L37AE/L43A